MTIDELARETVEDLRYREVGLRSEHDVIASALRKLAGQCRPYLQHKPKCANPPYVCTCGLDKLLAELEGK